MMIELALAFALEEPMPPNNGWLTFLTAVAQSESRGNPKAGLGLPKRFPEGTEPNRNASRRAQRNEARAARSAYRRNLARYAACPWKAQAYTFGSGGYFGLIAPNALSAFWDTELQCMDPAQIFEPFPAVVMALAMADRLMQYDGFQRQPTWINLRVGWGSPGAMGNRRAMRRMLEKPGGFGEQLDTLGVPRSFAHEHVPELMLNITDLFAEENRGGLR